MLCDQLFQDINTMETWDAVHTYLSHCGIQEITAYELYLALAQANFPVPIYVIKTILQRNPNLIKDEETFQMHVLLAYSSAHTPFATLKHLLVASGQSFQLANMLLRKSLRGDFGMFDAARALIRYEPGLLSHMDYVGNMPMHECCIYCESPAMVQLLIEEGLTVTGEWLPRNYDGMTAIDVALESDYIDGARHVLSILLHAAPDFPSKEEVLGKSYIHSYSLVLVWLLLLFLSFYWVQNLFYSL